MKVKESVFTELLRSVVPSDDVVLDVLSIVVSLAVGHNPLPRREQAVAIRHSTDENRCSGDVCDG